jgi:hypothetical protein
LAESWRTPTTAGWSAGSWTSRASRTRIWCEGEPAGELSGGRAALRAWLAARHDDTNQLVALADDEDPFYEQPR